MHLSFGRDSASSIFDRAVRWIDEVKHECANESEMLRWARRSAAHVDALLTVSRTWESIGALSPEQKERIERLAQTSSDDGKVVWLAPSADVVGTRGAGRRHYMVVFACAVVLACTLTFVWHAQGVLYETAVGESRVLILKDGSRVRMDSETRLRVRLSKTLRR
jgi:transmembrane sensor